MKILMTLKPESRRDFLTTLSGYNITKKDYSVVDDDDREISNFIMYRNDVDTRDIGKKELNKFGKEFFNEDSDKDVFTELKEKTKRNKGKK